MHSNNIFIKLLRWLLLPFSLLYGGIVMLRNFFYSKKVLRSATFNLPLICIGNLSTGGTGKSPMTEYIVRLLKDIYSTAVLSRGYGRKTKGYILSDSRSVAEEIGDEPLQFKKAFPEITVAVGERRVEAIPQLLYDEPQTELIILDDAFQHREVVAGLNILLTPYDDLYVDDFFLPTGNLRDEKKSAHRADIIVVTKCPPTLTLRDKETLVKKLAIQKHQHLFMAAFSYGLPHHLFNEEKISLSADAEVLVVTAIANSVSLIDYLSEKVSNVTVYSFTDHHHYTQKDMNDILQRFHALRSENKYIITTLKDAVKLQQFEEQLKGIPVYVLPVEHQILLNEKEAFDNLIREYVEKNLNVA